jgi:hypothetical protein
MTDLDEKLKALNSWSSKHPLVGKTASDHAEREHRASQPLDGRKVRARKVAVPMVQLNVRVSPDVRDWILEEAGVENMTIAEYLVAAARSFAASKGRSR